MLTKEVTIDRVGVAGPYKIIEIRELVTVKEDGVAISTSVNRRTVTPTDSADGDAAEVQAVKDLFHTAEVIADYEAFKASLVPATE